MSAGPYRALISTGSCRIIKKGKLGDGARRIAATWLASSPAAELRLTTHTLSSHRLLRNDAAVFHAQSASRHVHLIEVAVVMRNRYHRLAGALQLRQ